MADVFISYSRKDSDFVRQLHTALAAQNRDIWVDWEDIPATAEWWREICAGIEAADTFLFVISPDSVQSDVCRREIDHAANNQKRFVPVLRRDIAESDKALVHPSIQTHNWIFFRETDDFDRSFKTLIRAIDTDLSHVRAHTRLLVRAKEWEAREKDASLLLRGNDLIEAEAWLFGGAGKEPPPTDLQRDYITASRRAVNARQRLTVGGLSAGLVLALVLAAFALVQWRLAAENARLAQDNAATATFALGLAADNAATAKANEAIAYAAVATIENYLPQAVVVRGDITVYEGPGNNYRQITTLSQNQTISLLGVTANGNWILIQYAGENGARVRAWIETSSALQWLELNRATSLFDLVPVVAPTPSS